jgi:hypothetical protein
MPGHGVRLDTHTGYTPPNYDSMIKLILLLKREKEAKMRKELA